MPADWANDIDIFEGQIFVTTMREAMPSLLPVDATPEDAERVAAKLLPVLAEPVAVLGGAEHFAVSGSIGIAVCPNDTADPEKLVQYADMAMYEAKSAGKGRYVSYRSD